jgi:hypothetical protein
MDEGQFTRVGIQNFNNQHLWADTCNFDTMYIQTGLQSGITMLSWKTTYLISSPMHLWSFAKNCTLGMMTLLNSCLVAHRYPNWKSPGQRIGRGGPTGLPSCSPDLNPLDFCLWGNLNHWFSHLQLMIRKLSKTELCQVFRKYTTCQEFGITFGWQWGIQLRPVFRQEVNIWNIYCKLMCRAWCHRESLKKEKLCIFGSMLIGTIFIIYKWTTYFWTYAMPFLKYLYLLTFPLFSEQEQSYHNSKLVFSVLQIVSWKSETYITCPFSNIITWKQRGNKWHSTLIVRKSIQGITIYCF